MIYLAPLQGFTDFVYRNAYAAVFQGIDAFYIPYITTKSSQVPRKYEREILPENNLNRKSVPQVLAKDEEEILELCSLLRDYGYREINLNLGCPYPMVTNRGKGSKLLTGPDKLERMLEFYFKNFQIALSVKMRAGFESASDIEQIIPVLNRFPLKKVILHPRIAKQLYEGTIHTSAFQFAVDHLDQVPVYNGDVFTLADYQNRKGSFPTVTDWMLGRGVLMNVFLPDEIKGIKYTETEKRLKLHDFHTQIMESYFQMTDNPGNALNKMQQFWLYFSHHFSHQGKILKVIKKIRNPGNIKPETEYILRRAELKITD